MITIITDKINTFNQISYNKFLEGLDYHRLSCSCGMSGCLINHGYYNRCIKTSEGIITLSIMRVKCSHCGKTHAIFPQFIVPYSQILLNDHLSIIAAYLDKLSFEPIMLANEHIDESNIRYIIKQYLRHWKQRIAAFEFSIYDSSHCLSTNCLITFKRQFMQNKSTSNILFS